MTRTSVPFPPFLDVPPFPRPDSFTVIRDDFSFTLSTSILHCDCARHIVACVCLFANKTNSVSTNLYNVFSQSRNFNMHKLLVLSSANTTSLHCPLSVMQCLQQMTQTSVANNKQNELHMCK